MGVLDFFFGDKPIGSNPGAVDEARTVSDLVSEPSGGAPPPPPQRLNNSWMQIAVAHGGMAPHQPTRCKALLKTVTCLLQALAAVVILSDSSFAQSDPAKASFSHVGNLPVHFFSDNEEVADFVTAALTIVNHLAPDSAEDLQSGGTMTFVSAPDAILNDHMNTDYLWFLTSDQKAAVSDNSANGMHCYVQEYVFGEGGPWIAAASGQLEPEFAKMCFLVALRFWMGAEPQDYENQSLAQTFIGVLNEIEDNGGKAAQ